MTSLKMGNRLLSASHAFHSICPKNIWEQECPSLNITQRFYYFDSAKNPFLIRSVQIFTQNRSISCAQ